MPEQMRPASKEQAPDPSNNYERSHPENEAGAGRLDNNKSTPAAQPDSMKASVPHAQDGAKQLNAHDAAPSERASSGLPEQPDHSMLEEEPLGWDQAPKGGKDVQTKRHPRTGGEGGTPNVGQNESDS